MLDQEVLLQQNLGMELTWTEVADLNTARSTQGGSGTDNTNALAFGGFIDSGGAPEYFAGTESWNGSSWTEVADLNTARRALAAGGASNTNALAFGGFTGSVSKLNESWNGSSWTEVADLNTARQYLAGSGTQTDALAFGGLFLLQILR
jgi:hypothetical protein